MKTNKIRKLLLYIGLACSSASAAQTSDIGALLVGDVKGEYLGQYADNHKSKSGMGIDRIGGGGVYIGDFNRNKYNGKGMMLAGEKGTISNAPGAYAYVGGWIQGKKQGKGTCYAPNGDIIYSGKFENDKPVDPYPAPEENIDMTRYFSMMETMDGLFIGEIKSGVPHGFGLVAAQDGTIWIGTSRDGDRRGVGIFIYGPDVWSVVNYKDNVCTEINSSQVYDSRRQHFQEVKSRLNAEFWAGMLEVANGLAQVGSEYVAQKNQRAAANAGINQSSYESSSSAGSKGASKSSGSSASGKKGNDCGTAWMSDSRVYSNYETQLIKGGQSADDIATIKQRMRRIRKKWTDRGCLITKSPYED